jgi:hypothetical protein
MTSNRHFGPTSEDLDSVKKLSIDMLFNHSAKVPNVITPQKVIPRGSFQSCPRTDCYPQKATVARANARWKLLSGPNSIDTESTWLMGFCHIRSGPNVGHLRSMNGEPPGTFRNHIRGQKV